MRTTREAVQNANAKGRMRVMEVSGRLLVANVVSMGMKVDVAITVVFVFVSVDSKGFAERPATNPDEHNSDDALAPGGNQIHRYQVSQPK